MIVVDVNILVYHEIDGPFTAMTKTLLKKDPRWITSPLWSFEFVNVLATLMRSQKLELDGAFRTFYAAEAAYQPSARPVSQNSVLDASLRYGISGYDAQYIALAEMLQVPCVTADAPLTRKVPGIAVLLSEFIK